MSAPNAPRPVLVSAARHPAVRASIFVAALLSAPALAAAQQGPAPQPPPSFEPASPPPTAEITQAEARYERARAHYAGGRYRAASAALEEAARLDPEGVNLYFNLGVVYERMGDLDRAALAYARYSDRVSDEGERERVGRILARVRAARGLLAPRGVERGRADALFFVVTGAAITSAALSVTWFATSGFDEVEVAPVALAATSVGLGVFATVLYFARTVPSRPGFFASGGVNPGGASLALGARF